MSGCENLFTEEHMRQQMFELYVQNESVEGGMEAVFTLSRERGASRVYSVAVLDL